MRKWFRKDNKTAQEWEGLEEGAEAAGEEYCAGDEADEYPGEEYAEPEDGGEAGEDMEAGEPEYGEGSYTEAEYASYIEPEELREYEGVEEYAGSAEWEGTEEYADSGESGGSEEYAGLEEYTGSEEYADSVESEGSEKYGEYAGTGEYAESGHVEEAYMEVYAEAEGGQYIEPEDNGEVWEEMEAEEPEQEEGGYTEPGYASYIEPEEAEECAGVAEYNASAAYEEEEAVEGMEAAGAEYYADEAAGAYSKEEYAEPEYAEEEYAEPEHAEEEYTGEEYAEPEYAEEAYTEPEYTEEACAYAEAEGGQYIEPEGDGEAWEETEAEEPEYAEEAYAEPEYPEEAYPEPEYPEEEYAEPEYEQYMEQEENTRGYAAADVWQQDGFLDKAPRGGGRLELIDKVMLVAGAAILILALVAGGVYIHSRIRVSQVADFAGVGAQLEGISIIGEKGLAAVAAAGAARAEADVIIKEEDDNKGYDENAYDRQISVSPIFTSVQKDLKIKFINQKTGKLVPNIPFSVTVTDPAGKKLIWIDEDMDGVIHKEEIAGGQYQVKMEALEGPAYSAYSVSGAVQTARVEEEIVYKPVDVANEVKNETEVNAAKEDTKQNETVVESVLKDTVAWVESKVITDVYNEISKSEIPDPLTVAAGRILMTVSEDSGLPGSAVLVLDRQSATVFLTVPVVIAAAVENVSGEAYITAESSNPGVAQASVSGMEVTVTGIGEGSADITVRYAGDGGEAAAVCQVTVKNHPSQDTKTKLKDAAGRQLYVLENDAYREASHADYYLAERFFLKGDVRYSGWQTIEGHIFYFTADGARVTGEQVIQGAKYTFAEDGSLVTGDGAIGIDVSKWNQAIDWAAVKNSGMSYVIIRSGYRGSSAGKLIEDPNFEANIKGALAAGLKVGIYFYSQAVNEIEAVEEASMVLEQIKNYSISYPVFIDIEKSGGRGDKISVETRTAVCKAFCQTIQNAGYTAGVYSNKLWMEQKVNMAQLNEYKVWLAQYAASPTYSGKYDIWQYKANGSVSGISGNVDLNISYLK